MSFWDGLFLGDMLVSGSVSHLKTFPTPLNLKESSQHVQSCPQTASKPPGGFGTAGSGHVLSMGSFAYHKGFYNLIRIATSHELIIMNPYYILICAPQKVGGGYFIPTCLHMMILN